MIQCAVKIHATRSEVWQCVTDIDHADKVISAIDKIEVIERPTSGLEGLKWNETRVMFGKAATETMWISRAEPENWYQVDAENHGARYQSRFELREVGENTVALNMSFAAVPQTTRARLFNTLLGWIFSGSMRKVCQQDLHDIKAYLEQGNTK